MSWLIKKRDFTRGALSTGRVKCDWFVLMCVLWCVISGNHGKNTIFFKFLEYPLTYNKGYFFTHQCSLVICSESIKEGWILEYAKNERM